MATDNWQAPDADLAEQATPVTETEAEETELEVNDANEADVVEQSQAVPDEDEYRPE